MKVIVDTAVWSLALRRGKIKQKAQVDLLKELINDGLVVLIGSIRQELLSGLRHVEQFEKLKNHLRAFPDEVLQAQDYELAASFFDTCRTHGVQRANTDFLICAAAYRRRYKVLTTDQSFTHFSEHIPVDLLTVK